uniref:PHD-type domain-containing protein n=1 Tax=Rhabditophanes sp. KR3021 TaxID=114890 RepID=A0AC35TSR0_9BILA
MQDQDKSSKSNRRSNKKAVASGDGSIIQSPIGSPDDKEPLSPKQTKKRGGGRPPNANKTSSTKQTPGKSDSSPLKRVGSRNRKTMDQGTIAEMNAGPTEPRYCYCHRVSFGDMIGCDNDDCSLEWFHFKCVDIKIKPKGKWYCPDCRSSPETANLRNPNITTPNITTSANTPS